MSETTIEPIEKEKEKVIKHLVLNGGGTFGYIEYGILKQSNKDHFWEYENIETIYATSVGAIIGTMIALQIDWDVMDEYLINRPWQNVFKINIYTAINSLKTRGMLTRKAIEETIGPLLKSKDADIDITMKEFYDTFNIELHFFCTELNELCLVDMSYKTHPEWKVIDVVYSSCCLPFLFQPFFKDDKIYFDGGIMCNYPIIQCCANVTDTDEIFGIRKRIANYEPITEESSLSDYIFEILRNMISKISKEEKPVLKNEVLVDSIYVSIYDIYLATSIMEERKKLIDEGIFFWKNRTNCNS
jgi:hypothetical protein